MTGVKPKDAIRLEEVPLVESYPPEDMLPEDRLYCYFLQLRERHDNQCKGATDRYRLRRPTGSSEVAWSCDNQVMYHLKDGLERIFMKEELMLVPKNKELPQDYVQEW